MADEPTPNAPTPRVLDPGLIARLGAKATRRAAEVKAQAARIAQLETDLAAARTAADGSASAKRVKELEGQIRSRDARTAFDRLARQEGAADAALDDLWRLSDLDAAAPPDENGLSEVIAAHRANPSRAAWFAAPGATTTPTPTPAPRVPAPATGRGEPVGNGAPAISHDLVMSDPAYVMRNYDAVVLAAQAAVNSRPS